jgi:flagellar basal body-associated protein FliL
VVAQPEVISSPDPIVVRPKPTAPAKAEAAAPETKIETPKDDESGIVKGEDLGTDEANNWTPWIILFILILLAGAATGGYFYWFSDTPEGEEKAKEKATAKDKVKIQVRDKATEKSVEKAIEPEKNVEKQKEVTKQAAPQAKAPIVSNPVQNVKPAQGASKNNHKKTKRW